MTNRQVRAQSVGERRRVLQAGWLMLVAGCAGAAPQPAPALPTFRGRPVYDAPLATAPAAVQAVWPATQAELEFELSPPPTNSAEFSTWWEGPLAEWLRERNQMIQGLLPQWGELARGGPSDAVFGSVTLGLLYDHLATQVAAIELPPEVRANPEVAERYDGLVRQYLTEAIGSARETYALCVRAAPTAPPLLQDWSTTCLERSQVLERLLPRAPEQY